MLRALPALLVAAAGCGAPSGGLAFRLLSPDGLTDEIDHYTLKAWAASDATCNGAAVSVMNNAPPVASPSATKMQSVKLTVAAGAKTFYVEGFSDAAGNTKIAQGCQAATLVANVDAMVTIHIVRVGGPPPRVVFGSTANGFGMTALFAVDDIVGPSALHQISTTPLISPGQDFDANPVHAAYTGISSPNHIYLASYSGMEAMLTTGGPDSAPVFSPSGAEVAFVARSGAGGVITTVDVASSAETQVSSGTADAMLPAWSRDGMQLAWIEKPNGGNPRLMIGAAGKTAKALGAMPTGNAAPVWRPDGTIVVAVGSGSESLVVWDVAGDKLSSTVAMGQTGIRNVSLSADGNLLLFATGSPGAGDVQKYDFGAKKLAALAATGADEDWPSWSSDGQRVAYTVDSKVYVAAPDGTGAKRMTSSSGPILEVHPLFADMQ